MLLLVCISQDDCSVRLSENPGKHTLQQDISTGSAACQNAYLSVWAMKLLWCVKLLFYLPCL